MLSCTFHFSVLTSTGRFLESGSRGRAKKLSCKFPQSVYKIALLC